MAGYSNPKLCIHGEGCTNYTGKPYMYLDIQTSDVTVSGTTRSITISKAVLSAIQGASYFGYDIHVSAQLDNGPVVKLFDKDYSPSQWSTGDYKLASSVKLTSTATGSKSQLKILWQSICGQSEPNTGCNMHNERCVTRTIDFNVDTGYSITWNANGGVLTGTCNGVNVDGKSSYKVSGVPAGSQMSKYKPGEPQLGIPGFNFAGWTKDEGGDTPIPSTTEAKNVTYYAQYAEEIVVHWVYNGGADGVPGRTEWNDYLKRGGSTQFKYTLTRSGYEFTGWKDETDETIYPEMNLKLTNVQRRYNLTAQWKRTITGQLHYDTQGGTPIPPAQDLTSDPDSHKVNDKIIPEKKIHVYFKVVETGGTGPNPSDVTLTMPLDYYRPDRGVSKFKPGDSVPMSWKDGTLTAIYKDATFTSMSLPQDPKHPKGLKFIGWATQRSGAGNIGTKSSNTLPISLSSDTTYYAIWEQKFEYDPNGGTPNGGSPGNPITYKRIEQERSSTGIVLKTQAETFPDSVEQFLGWDTDKTATTPSYSPEDKYTGSASVMYAIWKKKDVKVTFDYKGGYDSNNSPGPKTVTVKYGGNATPPSGMYWKSQGDKPKKEFQGWMGKYKNVTYNTTVYALWEGSPVKIWTGTQWIPYFAGVALSEWEGSN